MCCLEAWKRMLKKSKKTLDKQTCCYHVLHSYACALHVVATLLWQVHQLLDFLSMTTKKQKQKKTFTLTKGYDYKKSKLLFLEILLCCTTSPHTMRTRCQAWHDLANPMVTSRLINAEPYMKMAVCTVFCNW